MDYVEYFIKLMFKYEMVCISILSATASVVLTVWELRMNLKLEFKQIYSRLQVQIGFRVVDAR